MIHHIVSSADELFKLRRHIGYVIGRVFEIVYIIVACSEPDEI